MQAWLREQGRGFAVGPALVPIVPGAILFDLNNCGHKQWGRFPPYRELGYAAAVAAADDLALGTHGAGFGANTVNLKGGLGSASAQTRDGTTVGAIVAVNAVGSVTVGDGPHFWAAPYEEDDEFGGLGWPAAVTPAMRRIAWKGGPQPGTTIGLVATDAELSKGLAKRLAIAAHLGLAKALNLSHALYDGDTIFSAATGRKPLRDPAHHVIEICAAATNCMARAIARGVYEATALPYKTAVPDWKTRFGGDRR